MNRPGLALTLLSLLLSSTSVAVARPLPSGAPKPTPEVQRALPPGAALVVTASADLTGDRKPETIVGYTLPRPGVPPTLGRAAVLERDSRGRLRRYDLAGDWPGHYAPAFTVEDLTGDGRPELISWVAGGAAWGMLRVFRRAADGYALLLEDDGLDYALYDADSDGRREVIVRHRLRSQSEQRPQRYIWRDGRFIAWHAPEWSYADRAVRPDAAALPDLTGLTLRQADAALSEAGFNLGVIAAVDGAAKAGRFIRYEATDGEVQVAIGAGDTSVSAAPLPGVAAVYLEGGGGAMAAPIAGTAPQRTRWRTWLNSQVTGVRQTAFTDSLSPVSGRHFLVELDAPWAVTLGGRRQTVRWVGVGTRPPHLGLLFLAPGPARAGYIWPAWQAALYTARPLPPLPVPPEQPLASYLTENPEADAFVTVGPDEWTEAIRLRGLAPEGWPVPEFAPVLEGPVTPEPDLSPIPDHVSVTVLNGFVRRAVRTGDDVRVQVVAKPGRAYRWIMPLTGFNQTTKAVQVHLEVPGQPAITRAIPLDSWRGWSGDPGPGSLPAAMRPATVP